MASIFNALYIGYSGLNASQVQINTTGHNIANAETEGYTRQRVVTSAAYPLTLTPGDIGNGVQVDTITRVFDAFVYDRYTKTAEDKAFSDFTRQTLETLSTYFPEIDDVGIKADLHSYFDMWQSLADNPDNNAVKVALAQQTQVLADHIQQTRTQVRDLQDQLNSQLYTAVDEVNRLAKEIAEVNKAINNSELAHQNNANDLRDQRNQLELAMAKLIGSDVFGQGTFSDATVDINLAENEGHYNIHIGGFNIVDGTTYHPIGITNEYNAEGFHDLYYQRQDGVRVPFSYAVNDGKVGAILDLRGSVLDSDTGIPEDGVLQDVLNQLDAFAAGLIEATNSIYARSATTSMASDEIATDPGDPLVSSGMNIKTGSFDVVSYDVDGNETARRTVNITNTTVMDDTVYDAAGNIVTPGTTNSIVGQLRAVQDDNQDGNLTNDIDSLLNTTFINGVLTIGAAYPSTGTTFAVEDNLSGGLETGTNFAGAVGLNRFFDGTSGKDIALAFDIRNDPSSIAAYQMPQSGNNDVAQSMVQLQYETIGFNVGTTTMADTVYGYFDAAVTNIGSLTNAAISQNNAITAQFNAVETEYFSISKVSIDEEMTNLIKYQTGYGAAAKVITTIDQMMDTLLGIKQ